MFVGKIGDVAKNSKLSVIDGTTMALGYRLAIDPGCFAMLESLFGSLYSADFHRGFMETFMAILKNLSMALTCLFGHSSFFFQVARQTTKR